MLLLEVLVSLLSWGEEILRLVVRRRAGRGGRARARVPGAGGRASAPTCWSPFGSALFTIASAYGFHDFLRPPATRSSRTDPTRIAAQIVTGIGFLGAGAISARASPSAA